MQFINKQSGEVHFAHNKADIKSYESSQAWEAVKEVVKAPKEEKLEKTKPTKETILDKLFK